MRKLIASRFVSLDGVLQGPGAPEEDTTSGFALGGWTYSFWDQAMGESMDGLHPEEIGLEQLVAARRGCRDRGGEAQVGRQA
jgi:hypothetical protein